MNIERYQRQIILNGFGLKAQEKLSHAKVLVIGAGGLGCPALQYLTAAGVGCVGIADGDVVELSNLQRQILFSSADLGLLKVEVAAGRLRQMNPEVQLLLHASHVDQHNLSGIISSYDIVFDGTDNFESRYLINDACKELGKPLVFAAVSGFEGQLAVFNTADENGIKTSYRDLFPIPPIPGEIPGCSENGVLGALSGIIGTMAAAEIIKLISGNGKTLVNKLLHYNLLTQEHYQINIIPLNPYQRPEEQKAIRNHLKPCDDFVEIDARQMTDLRADPSTLVIDVRERHEFPQLDPGIFKQVPMAELEEFVSSGIVHKNIILICQHGIRSQAAAEELYQIFGDTKNIYSLKGGISKWRHHF